MSRPHRKRIMQIVYVVDFYAILTPFKFTVDRLFEGRFNFVFIRIIAFIIDGRGEGVEHGNHACMATLEFILKITFLE